MPGLSANIEISIFDILLVIMHGFPSFLLAGGGAKIGISVFDIILVIIHGFPGFLLVGGGAKIGKFDARAPGRPDSRVPIRNLTP